MQKKGDSLKYVYAILFQVDSEVDLRKLVYCILWALIGMYGEIWCWRKRSIMDLVATGSLLYLEVPDLWEYVYALALHGWLDILSLSYFEILTFGYFLVIGLEERFT